jgi:hypothetical protein
MQIKRNCFAINTFAALGICALAALSAIQARAEDKKMDPTGTWTWTTPGRNGGPDRTNTVKLKMEGEKVTGKMMSPARGGETTTTEIEEGKMSNGEVSFSVSRETQNGKMTMKYHGKITDDSIKGKMDMERNGNPVSRDWEAKREEMKK